MKANKMQMTNMSGQTEENRSEILSYTWNIYLDIWGRTWIIPEFPQYTTLEQFRMIIHPQS